MSLFSTAHLDIQAANDTIDNACEPRFLHITTPD